MAEKEAGYKKENRFRRPSSQKQRPQQRSHRPQRPYRSQSRPSIDPKVIQKGALKRKYPLGGSPQRGEGSQQGSYVIDTSVIATKGRLSDLVSKKGLKGRIIIPDASVAELEHQANMGKEVGFIGLDELAKLHELKHKYNLKVEFAPPRPSAHEIRFAKSGEIDALIRSLAYGRKSTLVTSDFLQAKSAAAYGIKVWFVKSTQNEQKKRFFFFKK